MAVPREVKFVMDKTIYSKWYLNWILKMFKVIPISNGSKKQRFKQLQKS